MVPEMDYVVVTKNNAETIDACIQSIFAQGNAHRVIVVVSLKSTDDTIGHVKALQKEFPKRLVLRYERVGLAYARKLAIGEVVTRYFVFVDGDIELASGWANGIYENFCILEKAGGIVGLLYRNQKQHLYLYNHGKLGIVSSRMFTHNTMLDSDLVKDWNPDNSVNSYEDYLLTKHIQSKGFFCYQVPIFSYHRHQGSDIKAAAWGAAGGRKLGYFGRVRLFKEAFVGVIGGFKRTVIMRDRYFLMFALRQMIGMLYGYLRWTRFV